MSEVEQEALKILVTIVDKSGFFNIFFKAEDEKYSLHPNSVRLKY